MPSLSPQFSSFLKMRSKPSKPVISVIDLTSMENMNHNSFDFKAHLKWMHRTNEATGRVVNPLIQLDDSRTLHIKPLFPPGSTWTSSPKSLPMPLILLGRVGLVKAPRARSLARFFCQWAACGVFSCRKHSNLKPDLQAWWSAVLLIRVLQKALARGLTFRATGVTWGISRVN
jgi:hypothetical protein